MPLGRHGFGLFVLNGVYNFLCVCSKQGVYFVICCPTQGRFAEGCR